MRGEDFWGLRWRLALGFAGVFGALLLAFGWVAHAHLAQVLVQQADLQNERAATDVLEAVAIGPQGLKVEAQAFAEEAREAQALMDVIVLRLTDAEGRVLASTEGLAAEVPPQGVARESWQGANGRLRLLRQALGPDPERPVAWLLVGRDMREGQAALDALARDVGLILPLAALLTLLGGVWMSGLVLRPIREAFEAQSRFIADASHALRTPLAILLAQAEAGQGASPEAAQDALKGIESQALRLGRLASGWLLLLRADAGALSLPRHRFALDEWAEEAVAEHQARATALGVALRFEAHGEDLTVAGDPESLRQALDNLLDNALGHSPQGGWVRLRVGPCPQAPGFWALGVQDSGPGLPEELLSAPFERFRRGQATQRSGSGLGLAIAQAIAEAHGGQLHLLSAPGEGAHVLLRLPQAPA